MSHPSILAHTRYRARVDERALRKKRDHELIELLNELRVALPGAQVLFAFLLVVPFSSRFNVDRTEKVAYMVALLATLTGTILLIAPSAYHRLRWREKNKEQMLRTRGSFRHRGSRRDRRRDDGVGLPRHRRAACREPRPLSSASWQASRSGSHGSPCRSRGPTTAGTTTRIST